MAGTYIILALTLVFAVVVIYITLTVRNATKFRLREFNGNRSLVTDYLMMEKTDRKDGTRFLISVPWQKKLKVIDPPNECIDIGRTGKRYLEAHKLSEDEFLFLQDKGYHPDDVVTKDGKTIKEGFEKFTVTQRSALVNQMAKAQVQKQKSFLRPEVVLPGTAIMALTIIIIMGFILWGDIAQPSLQSHQLALNVQKQNIEIMRALNIQILGSDNATDTAVNARGETVIDDIQTFIR